MILISLLGFLFYPICLTSLQKSHEKTPLQKWEHKFLDKNEQLMQTQSLVNLIRNITNENLATCTVVILYDVFTENGPDRILEQLLNSFPIPIIHGQITENYFIKIPQLLKSTQTCVSYILFLKDVMRSKSIIGTQSYNKVIIVARSSSWRVYEFLANEESQNFMNLLVIAKQEKISVSNTELPYILYTHKLYIDAIGSSVHQVITSWKNNSFTVTNPNLFPKKMEKGFAGHRFIVALAHQPPFVIKRTRDENNDLQWDGIEVRLVSLLAKMFNFTTDYREASDWNVIGSNEAVTAAVSQGKANLGIAGLYITYQRIGLVDMSQLHSQDCATFMTLASTALSKYRAIMGPFHWSVWVSLIFIYLFAIVLLAFSDKHTLKHLIKEPEEMENMFWYVYGTFTNAFSFVGKNTWGKSKKFATRLLIGFYWLFTIIITACYTGSIIAFVTLPVYPNTVDTPSQLLKGRYQIGTLNKEGWQYWFENSSDPTTKKLLTNVDLVPNIQSGLKNMTKAFFWPYAFMGSRAQLSYVVRTNFTTKSKRSVVHIATECFAPFSVSLAYTKNSLYNKIIDTGVYRIVESGLVEKLQNDVEWLIMRSATGKLLAANSIGKSTKTLSVEDKALTIQDTQGMFLLLAFGFILGAASLLSEWMGGCFHFCKKQNDFQPEHFEEENIEEESSNEVQVENSLEEIDQLFSFEDYFGHSSNSVEENCEEEIKKSN